MRKGNYCLLAVLTATLGFAQTPRVTKVDMQIGALTVWLGMPKGDALALFKAQGYKQTDMGDQTYYEIRDGTLSTIGFKGDRLSYATRSWRSKENDDLASVIAVLTELSSKHQEQCTLRADTLREPDMNSERLFVDCGRRGVLIAKGTIAGTKFAEVMEYIGH